MLQAYLAKIESDPGRETRMLARSRALFPLRTLGGAGEPEFRLQDEPSQSFLRSVPIIFFVAHATRDPKWVLLRRNLDELAELGRRYGFDLILMGYPKSEMRPVNAILQEFALSRGLDFVDLLAAVGDVDKDASLRSADQVHPNAKGYALIAERLLESGVLQRRPALK